MALRNPVASRDGSLCDGAVVCESQMKPEQRALAVVDSNVRTGLRPPIDAAVRQIIAERLQEDPLASHQDIAEQIGVSHDFVTSIAKKLKGEDGLGERRQKSLQRQIGKTLTVKQRAMVIADVALGKANAKASFSQLAAVKLANELDNVVTAKERREVADNSAPVLPPMFVLKDCTVDIGGLDKPRLKKGSRK